MTLIDRIKKSGLQGTEIAQELGITLMHLGRITSGSTEPTLSQGIRLGYLLKCAPQDILDSWRMEREGLE